MKKKSLSSEETMTIPPEINNLKVKSNKKTGLFSKAILRESWKSNRKGLTIVSLFNGILIFIIVVILASLNLNASSKAMANLFTSSGSEGTLKSSAVTLYSSYYNVADSYEQFSESYETVNSSLSSAVNLVDDSTVSTLLNTSYTTYRAAYIFASGDDSAKHESAKQSALNVVTTLINNQESLSDSEKTIVKTIVDQYLDKKHEDSSASNQDILVSIIPGIMTDVLNESISLSSDDKETINALFSSLLNDVYSSSLDRNEAITNYTFMLLKILSSYSEELSDSSYTLISYVENSYLSNQDSFINVESYRNQAIANAVCEVLYESTEELLYYNYLPDFEVLYMTSDLGYPITYEEVEDENGNITKVKVELKEYNPDKFITVEGGLATTSTILQKMHKDVITGVSYTNAEIEAAKEASKNDFQTLKNKISTFVSVYLIKNNGVNEYYDGEKVVKDSIKNYVLDELEEEITKELISSYNSTYEANITSIDEITSENGQTDGRKQLELGLSYGASAITSYEYLLEKKQSEGYSYTDSTTIAMVNSSLGIMDQLPTKTSSALEEMSDGNIYGVVVGKVGFGTALLLIPLVYTIILANSLVSEKVETGSLAFTLSTPIKRKSFIFTEGIFLVFCQIIMALTLLVFAILAREIGIWIGGADFVDSLKIQDMILFNFGNFGICLVISSICFFTSSFFNKSRLSTGVGGGISIWFFIANILGIFGSRVLPSVARITSMNFFNYLTITSLFNCFDIIDEHYVIFFLKMLVLVIISFVFYFLSIIKFDRKDLPL